MNKGIVKSGGGAVDLLAPPQGGRAAMSEALVSREMAEVQGQILLAKRFPRDYAEVESRIMNACLRPGLAAVACYEYARGGQNVKGASIRLAEAMAQNYGNLSFGIRELEQSGGESTCEAFAWDMETNVRQVKIFHVSHKRVSKKNGQEVVTLLTDPRDIYEMVANSGARRLRACILSIIPGDLVDMAVEACEKTMLKKDGEVTPEVIKKMLEWFAANGVSQDVIERFIQRSVDSITPALMGRLRKIMVGMKDGMGTARDYFGSAMDDPKDKGERPKSSTSLLAPVQAEQESAGGTAEGQDGGTAETPDGGEAD